MEPSSGERRCRGEGAFWRGACWAPVRAAAVRQQYAKRSRRAIFTKTKRRQFVWGLQPALEKDRGEEDLETCLLRDP